MALLALLLLACQDLLLRVELIEPAREIVTPSRALVTGYLGLIRNTIPPSLESVLIRNKINMMSFFFDVFPFDLKVITVCLKSQSISSA